jgi:hypothetical protein
MKFANFQPVLRAILTIMIVVALCVQVAVGHFVQALALGTVAAAVLHGFVQRLEPSACFANTLTNLIADTYVALDVVSREIVGFIPSVARDARVDRCALNATIRSEVAPANTAGTDITPAMSVPSAADQTIGNKTISITKARAFPFSWSGEEQYSMNTAGPGYLNIRQDQVAQAIRAACNEVETDIAVAARIGSRAFGTAGTTPFASNTGDAAQMERILTDNGAPRSARSLVINTTAGAALRTLSQLTKVNEAGTAMTLRDGELLNLSGFSVKESAQVQSTTAGTGSGYLINNGAGYAIGSTSLTLDTGTGTILAGDIVTIGNFKYVVATALTANVIVISAPGLQAAVADNATVTVNATSARNVAFSQNAIYLATRLPAAPEEGDLAVMVETIIDPRSGLAFELRVYGGYRMVRYEIAIAWGVSVIKPEHVGILLG